jgi:hypothetical protein
MLLRKMKMQVMTFRTARFYEPTILMMRSFGWGERVQDRHNIITTWETREVEPSIHSRS